MPILLAALALLSAALVRLMVSRGTLDVPGARSSHTMPTPKGGGVGIVAAYAAGLLWLCWHSAAWRVDAPIAAAVVTLAVICYMDDIKDWPFRIKLAAQSAAAIVALAALGAFSLVWPGDFILRPGPAGFVITFGWIMFVTNAVNFIDGLNGLASGCTFIGCLLLAFSAPLQIAAPALVLAAGIAGFLPFNYPRARIFMGDVGSQACGFLLAVFALRAAAESRASLVVPLSLLPILGDAAFTLARRALAGARLTQAHRGHLYQVAQRSGLPASGVTAIYWAMTAWGGLCGLLAGRGESPWPAVAACLAAALPLLPWGAYVAWKANRAGVTVW